MPISFILILFSVFEWDQTSLHTFKNHLHFLTWTLLFPLYCLLILFLIFYWRYIEALWKPILFLFLWVECIFLVIYLLIVIFDMKLYSWIKHCCNGFWVLHNLLKCLLHPDAIFKHSYQYFYGFFLKIVFSRLIFFGGWNLV